MCRPLSIFSAAGLCLIGFNLSFGQQSEPEFSRVDSVTSEDFFYEESKLKPGFVQVTFQTDETGANLVRDKNVDVIDKFTFLGCKVTCEEHAARVIIS